MDSAKLPAGASDELTVDDATDWCERARKAGLSREVAEAGRKLIHLACTDRHVDHPWDAAIVELASVSDEGWSMLQLASDDPATALRVWSRIIETRGLRGEAKGEHWRWWPVERRMREKYALLAAIEFGDPL